MPIIFAACNRTEALLIQGNYFRNGNHFPKCLLIKGRRRNAYNFSNQRLQQFLKLVQLNCLLQNPAKQLKRNHSIQQKTEQIQHHVNSYKIFQKHGRRERGIKKRGKHRRSEGGKLLALLVGSRLAPLGLPLLRHLVRPMTGLRIPLAPATNAYQPILSISQARAHKTRGRKSRAGVGFGIGAYRLGAVFRRVPCFGFFSFLTPFTL